MVIAHADPTLQVHAPAPRGELLGHVDAAELRVPLDDALAALCARAAERLDAEVVTLYAREAADGEDVLMARGNVGLADGVVGNLRLRVGDGIVGWVAECMRPLSVVVAGDDHRNKHVRGIGEEAFPAMMASPIVRGGRVVGVIAAQRAGHRPFDERDVRAAGLVGEMAALVLEAGLRRGAARGGEAACLLGRALVPGLGLGRAVAVPTVEALARRDHAGPGGAEIAAALTRVERDLARAHTELGRRDARVARALGRLGLIVADGRLRQAMLAAPGGDLARVTRTYARASVGRHAEPHAAEHGEDIVELCALVAALATGDAILQPGRVWLAHRLGPWFALVARRAAAAIVLDDAGVATDDALALATAAAVPVVAGVRGLFGWTQPGDLLVVDADRDLVRVNPSASGLARARGERDRRP